VVQHELGDLHEIAGRHGLVRARAKMIGAGRERLVEIPEVLVNRVRCLAAASATSATSVKHEQPYPRRAAPRKNEITMNRLSHHQVQLWAEATGGSS